MAKANTLIDNFNDNTLDTAKWDAYGNPAPSSERIRETNNRVEIRPRSADAGKYSGYVSDALYDLTASFAFVEMAQAPRQAAGVETFFMAEANSSNAIHFSLLNDDLRCFQNVGGIYTQLASVPYELEKHRWLRLREQSGTSYWEVSADGSTWTVLFSKANPIALTSVRLKFQVGLTQAAPSPGMAIFDNLNVVDTAQLTASQSRRTAVVEVRNTATGLVAARPVVQHANNRDEGSYAINPYIGNYSKSLEHDSLGDPVPASYDTLLSALQSGTSAAFEAIDLASPPVVNGRTGPIKLTNPQAGYAFELEGPDPQEITMIPAPRFDSEQTAHEMGELYWMALARDVPFTEWPSQGAGTVIQNAITSLNTEFTAFGGAVPVTVQNLFRGIYPGEQIGPYVSQFLLKGNVDTRKPAGQGRDAGDGFVSYGAQGIDQRITPAIAGRDYLYEFPAWLNAQNGADLRGADEFGSTRRFIASLRDGATYVHIDQVLNAFYNAAWILMSEPLGNQATAAGAIGRPQIDLELSTDVGNPYDPPAPDSPTESGFATFGPIHILEVLGQVLGRALRAVWWQKWGVHRRLRPEEYGGRVHNEIRGLRDYPLHASIVSSLSTGLLSSYFGQSIESFPTYLLPQAYPEGAPTHPAYGAGHAAGAGACATILKAFFDESRVIESPRQASSNGVTLLSYTGADAGQITVGGELNKLAGNISLFRNAAGVHWRSDHTESLPFGEAVAIRLLQEMSLTFREADAFFELTRFNGTRIRIADGQVTVVG